MNSLSKIIWGNLDSEYPKPFSSITTLSPVFWKRNGSINKIGPFMILIPKTRSQCVRLGFLPKVKKDIEIDTDDLSNLEILNEARYFVYNCNYEKALEICKFVLLRNKQIDPKVRLWSAYIKSLFITALGVKEIDQDLLFEYESYLKKGYDDEPTVELQIIRSLISLGNIEKALFWINRVLHLINSKPLNTSIRSIVFGRIARYRAEILSSSDLESAQSILKEGIEEVRKHNCPKTFDEIVKGNFYNFLLVETQRRLVDHLAFYCDKTNHYKYAISILENILEIDPMCHRLRLMVAEYQYKIGDHNEAEENYQKAINYGSLEPSFCYLRLAKLTKNNLNKNYLLSESEVNNVTNFIYYKQSKLKIAKGEKINLNSPFLMSSTNTWGTSIYKSDELRNRIQRNEIYSTLLSYWELNKPQKIYPIHGNAPLLSFQAFKDEWCPWFMTLTCQRAMVNGFREELSNSSVSQFDLSEIDRNELSSFNFFGKLSQKNHKILEAYNTKQLPSLKKSLLSRLLASLGFFEEAIQLVSLNNLKEKPSLESAYEAVTWFFHQSVVSNKIIDLPHITHEILNSVPDTNEAIRMKFTLALNGCVLAGQRNSIKDTHLFRKICENEKKNIFNSVYFNDFEKCLLLSRFYRGVSYLPYLQKNKKWLQEDAQLCEKYARELAKYVNVADDRQNILYLENLFPMLESSSRIWSFLGDKERARDLMEEIVEKVDAIDTKAWLQVGEINERLQNLDKAHEAYLNAASLQCPLGRIAWYKLGRSYENRGEFNKAVSAYLVSLKIAPDGISPLIRIFEINKGHNFRMKNWAKEIIEQKCKKMRKKNLEIPEIVYLTKGLEIQKLKMS